MLLIPAIDLKGGRCVRLRQGQLDDETVYSDDPLAMATRWVEAGAFRHPAMFGFGPGHEQNTHKIGECVDSRELAPVVAFYARFPSLYAVA